MLKIHSTDLLSKTALNNCFHNVFNQLNKIKSSRFLERNSSITEEVNHFFDLLKEIQKKSPKDHLVTILNIQELEKNFDFQKFSSLIWLYTIKTVSYENNFNQDISNNLANHFKISNEDLEPLFNKHLFSLLDKSIEIQTFYSQLLKKLNSVIFIEYVSDIFSFLQKEINDIINKEDYSISTDLYCQEDLTSLAVYFTFYNQLIQKYHKFGSFNIDAFNKNIQFLSSHLDFFTCYYKENNDISTFYYLVISQAEQFELYFLLNSNLIDFFQLTKETLSKHNIDTEQYQSMLLVKFHKSQKNWELIKTNVIDFSLSDFFSIQTSNTPLELSINIDSKVQNFFFKKNTFPDIVKYFSNSQSGIRHFTNNIFITKSFYSHKDYILKLSLCLKEEYAFFKITDICEIFQKISEAELSNKDFEYSDIEQLFNKIVREKYLNNTVNNTDKINIIKKQKI